MPRMGSDTLTLRPIGYIRTGFRVKFEAPHQPDPHAAERNTIELNSDSEFELALRDLDGFDRIWLVWWFHRNGSWRPLVLPPRGSPRRRGVFATRSPHRPNPVGMTCVPLIAVDGLRLTVGACDLLDGTPILDIKPYIPGIDAFPDARSGWVDDIEESLTSPPAYAVALGSPAAEQAAWLRAHWGVDFIDRAVSILERDPRPHRTRRIRAWDDGLFRMGCGAWRLFFSVNGSQVTVRRIESGFPERYLFDARYSRIPDREAQIAFREQPAALFEPAYSGPR
jgi:tRNA-Thr(GGU) m(6)t(6)A37 methyltransferase TsaA